MRLFLDTAIVSDVEERLPTGLISGITTNPTLIKKSGREPEDVYRELLNLGVMDLSIEVPGTDCTEFIANGFQAVRDWGSYATVKLPCTVEGLKACKYLEEHNVRCNVTLVFSVSQAVLCGIARATYVAPFVGRVDDNGLDGLKLVKPRSEAMYEVGKKNPGTMAAVIGLSDEQIQNICSNYTDGIVCVANYNSPSQVVISGETSAISNISSLLIEKGAIKVVRLNVSGAFHSPLMREAKDVLKEHLSSMNIENISFPVYTNLTSKPAYLKSDIYEALLNQIDNPVLWSKSISKIVSDGINKGVEIGPSKVLQGLTKRIDRSLIMYGAESYEDILNLTNV